MAMSANGMIADQYGAEDFLPHDNWIAFVKLAKKIGNFVYGRKTYEAVLGWPPNYIEDLSDVVKIVISKDKSLEVQGGFIQVDDPKQAISYLEKKGFGEALVAGGNTVYSSFLKKGLADEIIVDVNPITLSHGIPVFGEEVPNVKLELLGTNSIGEGIVELHYRLLK